MDYAHIMTRVPELHDRMREEENAVADASEAIELAELVRSIPKLVGILPDFLRDRSDTRHAAALAVMILGLMLHCDRIQPLALVSSQPTVCVYLTPCLIRVCRPMSDRLGHMSSSPWLRTQPSCATYARWPGRGSFKPSRSLEWMGGELDVLAREFVVYNGSRLRFFAYRDTTMFS